MVLKLHITMVTVTELSKESAIECYLNKFNQMHKHIYLLDFKKKPTYVASKYIIIIIIIIITSPRKWVLQLF
jgi:hypothetical protein